jgi:membrane-associated phospholipid phosphatase
LRTADPLEARLLIAALLCVLAVLALGAFVAHRTPTRLDVEAGALRGGGVPLALFFTGLGRWPVLLGLSIAAGGVALALRTSVAPVLILFGTQVVSQGANALVKLGFHRTRPDAWLLIQEKDLSYPSGHAVTSIVFFLGFALLAWHSALPRPLAFAVVVACAICVAGVPWSRLALSAHYATDVLGGLLFGAAWLCVALVVIVRVHQRV